MGTCQTNNTVSSQFQAQPPQAEPLQQPPPPPPQQQKSRISSSNPFYQLNQKDANDNAILSKYDFHSKYKDQYLGDCSVIEQKSTGDLFLCKELRFQSEEHKNDQMAQLQARQRNLNSDNVIRIKQIFTKSSDGFFGEDKKIFIVIDYPFINFQRQIVDRIGKKISFTKQQVINFFSSTVRGYSAIQRAGYTTDKIRLKNIFIGIKNKQPIIKVAESSLIEPKSNFQYMIDDGPNKLNNRDIYLSPQEYLAWIDDNQDYKPRNPKSGVYSLAMCFLDVCIMDPSRECYHYTEKQIDQLQVKNRIQIVGKKYGTNLQKLLKQMLQPQPQKRISFSELQQSLPSLTKNPQQPSIMRLSVIPSQKSNYINNDATSLKSSQMFKSVVSQSQSNIAGSRVFASRIKMDKSRIKEEQIIDVTEHYTNGNKYKGQKKGGSKCGRGRYQLQDGSYFQGEWADNKINGIGTLFFKNGKIQYQGEWRNDLYNGWGTLYSEIGNWNKYEGEFKNGVKEGRGRIFFRDGSMYDGEFKNDKISGRGRKITGNGEVQQRYWQAIAPQKFM